MIDDIIILEKKDCLNYKIKMGTCILIVQEKWRDMKGKNDK